MRLLTRQALNVSPMRLRTSMELNEIAAKLSERQYPGTVPSEGWGGVPLTPEGSVVVGPGSLRVLPGSPVTMSVPASEGNEPTEMAVARFLFDRVDPELRRRLAPEARADLGEQAYRLDAVEVAIASSPFSESEYVVFAGSHDDEDLSTVRTAIGSALGLDDRSESIERGYGAFRPEPDLFLWLIRRQGAGYAAPRLSVDQVDRVDVEDQLRQRTFILDMATTDRDVVCLYVQNENVEFGPGRIMLTDEQVSLSLNMDLKLNGSFSILVGDSEYLDGTTLNTPGGRLKAVRDVGRVVIPRLLGAYEGDSNWDSTERTRMRDEARQTLKDLLGF